MFAASEVASKLESSRATAVEKKAAIRFEDRLPKVVRAHPQHAQQEQHPPPQQALLLPVGSDTAACASCRWLDASDGSMVVYYPRVVGKFKYSRFL